MIDTPKGETIPQTVENLQAIMAEDAKTMLDMEAEHRALRAELDYWRGTAKKYCDRLKRRRS